MLLQEHEECLFPVCYISKKLLPKEVNYSTVEKKCYAIIWAISKLQVYLLGNEFILLTDHKSLTFLNKAKHTNQRLNRWALSLQPFSFKIEALKGNENLGSDYLSRQ